MIKKMDLFNESKKDNIYVKIRKSLNLKIDELNSKLNIDWNDLENGECSLDSSGIELFIKYFYNKNEEILKKIVLDNIASNLNLKSGDLIHGSKGGLRGKIRPVSSKFCDFGEGFYVGDTLEQVATLIAKFNDSVIYKLDINLNNLLLKKYKVSHDWALCIASNRGYLDKYNISEEYLSECKKYDVIFGPIADDRMFNALEDFTNGYITDIVFIQLLRSLGIGNQYVFKTDRACSAINIVSKYKLTNLERKLLMQISRDNKNIANDHEMLIRSKYMREGKFLIEILNEGGYI